MNSLSELNGYVSSLSFEFTDQREPNVLFDRASAENQSQIADEGFTISSSIGIEITDILNPDVSLPYYTIDIRNITGATLTWPTLPAGVTASEPTSGIYRLNGISSVAIWNTLKQASINLAANFNGLYSYTSTINYFSQEDGNTSKSWITALNINEVLFLTTPLSVVYDIDAITDIDNAPNIINVDSTYPGVTWTVTVTPNNITPIDTFTSTGTGGSFTVNPTTKVITITGTRAEVNSHLNSLKLDSNNNSFDISLTYSVSNSQDGNTDSAIQLLINENLLILGNVTQPTLFYTEDAAGTISGYPQVTDSVYDGSGNYTYTITPSNVSALNTLSTSGSSGSQSFNSTTKVLTLTGTRSEINTRLATLSYDPASDFADAFTLTYTVTTPRFETASKLQSLVCGSNDTEITNMNLNRNYVGNRSNYIFTSSIPFISDFDDSGIAYVLRFEVPQAAGYLAFGNDLPTSHILIYSGTKAQCNSVFSQVRFYPVKNLSTNVTLNYLQRKLTATQDITQVNQNITLIGTAGSFQNTRQITLGSGFFTPTFEDALYGTWDIELVGGGGGGALGGGGGGELNLIYGEIFPYTSFTAVVGQGGVGAQGSANIGFGQGSAQGGGTTTFYYSNGQNGWGASGGGAATNNSLSPRPGAGGGWDSGGNPRFAGIFGGTPWGGGGAGATGIYSGEGYTPASPGLDGFADGQQNGKNGSSNGSSGGNGGRSVGYLNRFGLYVMDMYKAGAGGGGAGGSSGGTGLAGNSGQGGNGRPAGNGVDGTGGGGGGGSGGFGGRGGNGRIVLTVRAA